MDAQSSFLALCPRKSAHPWRRRWDPPWDTEYSEAQDTDSSMTWAAFYLTDAIDQRDSHVACLMIDVGLGFDLHYPRYQPIAMLIEAIAGTFGAKEVRILKTLFAYAGPFISETGHFVTHMLGLGMNGKNCGLLLDLGLMNVAHASRRADLLDTALARALSNMNNEAVEALLSTGECNPNTFVDDHSPDFRRFMNGSTSGSALSYCLYTGQKSNLQALLNTGKCDLELADSSDGMTALMRAASQGMHIFVRAFVETGACRLDYANVLDRMMTPLSYAASGGHTETVRDLLAGSLSNIYTRHSTAFETARPQSPCTG